MSETTGPQRAAFAAMINKGQGVYVGDVPRTGLRSLLNDAGRLAAIEKRIEAMIADYEFYGVEGVRASSTAKELRAILDPEG